MLGELIDVVFVVLCFIKRDMQLGELLVVLNIFVIFELYKYYIKNFIQNNRKPKSELKQDPPNISFKLY